MSLINGEANRLDTVQKNLPKEIENSFCVQEDQKESHLKASLLQAVEGRLERQAREQGKLNEQMVNSMSQLTDSMAKQMAAMENRLAQSQQQSANTARKADEARQSAEKARQRAEQQMRQTAEASRPRARGFAD